MYAEVSSVLQEKYTKITLSDVLYDVVSYAERGGHLGKCLLLRLCDTFEEMCMHALLCCGAAIRTQAVVFV